MCCTWLENPRPSRPRLCMPMEWELWHLICIPTPWCKEGNNSQNHKTWKHSQSISHNYTLKVWRFSQCWISLQAVDIITHFATLNYLWVYYVITDQYTTKHLTIAMENLATSILATTLPYISIVVRAATTSRNGVLYYGIQRVLEYFCLGPLPSMTEIQVSVLTAG